jgi:hypothetical protein
MPAYSFGSGTLVGVRTDVANATPSQFGVLQDVQVDFSATLKELMGQNQFAVAVARSAMKVTGKIKSAKIVGSVYNDLFFGQTAVTGAVLQAVNEAGTVPTTPYQITVSNAATFLTDLGVLNATTGLPLKKVASAPATGQYSVNSTTGVYTFAAADTTVAVLISYTYSSATGATKITIANQLQGAAPTFQMNLAETYNSKVLNFQLNACVANKLSFPLKNSDWTINDIEFQAFADAAGNVGYLTTSE